MANVSRRDFFKIAGGVVAGAAISQMGGLVQSFAQAPVVGSTELTHSSSEAGSHAKVYFTKHIDAAHLISLYDRINEGIYGKVAVKLHTGEKHGPNILPRDMVKAFIQHVPDSTIVETNTLYQGDRYTTAGHRETLQVNGWTFCPVDIMDEEGDVNLPVRGGKHLKEVAMGGFGGSMKNIAIGCASGQVGKRQVHGVAGQPPADWNAWPAKEHLMELMADSAKATVNYFGKHIVYLNVLRRMSVDCDCAGTSAAEPTIPDIGILASTDILAIDQVSVDLVWARSTSENHDLVERIESRHGLHQLQAMKELKMGNPQYEFISIDE